MLSQIEIENFKAFSNRVKVPLAPITLIFGKNSSGKSSILQSLNLLKQTIESRDALATLLPRTENGIVNLGNYNELINMHNNNKDLVFKLDFELNKNNERLIHRDIRNWIKTIKIKTISIEYIFNQDQKNLDIDLIAFNLYTSFSDEPICKYEKTDIGKLRNVDRQIVNQRLRSSSISNAYKCTFIDSDPFFWKPVAEYSINNKDKIIRDLQNLKKEFIEMQDTDAKKEINESINFYKNLIAINNSDITELIANRVIENEKKNLIGTKKFTPYSLYETEVLPEWFRTRQSNRFKPNLLAISLGSLCENILTDLFPLGPFRKLPERLYVYTGSKPADVGYSGELLPHLLFREKNLILKTNDWLKKMDVGYSLKLRQISQTSKDLFEIRLLDVKNDKKIEVGLSDVGFGISQLLPFIVQSLAKSNQLISIEQPEVHIHPQLQADLGDLLCHAIKKPLNNKFIIETHSEHLILRLQKLVRMKELRNDKLSIIYVSKNRNCSSIKELKLDGDGYFIDDWPEGFFPERLNELI